MVDDDPEYDARAEGYDWPDIDEHIASSSNAAFGEGYSKEEIDSFLGRRPGADFDEDARAAWLQHLDENPDADLLNGPDLRGLYGNALRDRHTVGPQDFADRYAAAMLGAGSDADMHETAMQAKDLADTLPSRRDFIDSSLGLPGADRDSVDNLIDHYSGSGQPPEQAVSQARKDPALLDQLTSPRGPTKAPGWFDRFGTGVMDMVLGANQLMEHALPKGFKDAADATYNGIADTFGMAKITPNSPSTDAFIQTRDRILKEQGYDGWVRMGGQIAATFPMFLTFGLEGLGGMIMAGATGGLAQAAFTPTTAEAYWAAKAEEMTVGAAMGAVTGGILHGAIGTGPGGVVRSIGKMISEMEPAAAAELGKMAPDLLDPMVTQITHDDVPRMVRASEANAETPRAQVHIEEGAPLRVAIRANDQTFEGAAGEIHADVAVRHKLLGDLGKGSVDGFVDDSGKFYTREEAAARPTSTTKIEGDRAEIEAATARLQEQHRMAGGDRPLPVIDPDALPASALDTLHEFGMAKDGIKPKPDAGGYWQGLYQAGVEAGHIKANPAVEALAIGRDAVDGVGGLKDQIVGMLPRSIRDLWTDTSGTLLSPTLRTPMQRLMSRLNFETREVERTSLRRMMGLNAQMSAQLKENLKGLERALMPHEAEHQAAKKAAQNPLTQGTPAANASNTVIGQFTDAIEGGTRLSASHPLAPYVDMMKTFYGLLDREAKIRAADPKNPFTMEGYIKNYMAHMIEDPDKAIKELLGTPGGGAEIGGKTGRAGNFMQRTGPPKLTDLINAGVQLKHDRIFPMLMDDLRARAALFQWADKIEEGVANNHYIWSAKGPPVPGWTPLKGRFTEKEFIAQPDVGSLRAPEAAIARQYARQNGVSYQQAVQDLAAQGHVTPRTAQDVLNEQKIGHMQLYAMPSVAKQLELWNQMAAYKNTSNHGIWDSLLYAKNALTGIKLAVAGFHMNTIALGSMAGTFGRAVETAGYGIMQGRMDLMKLAMQDIGLWATPGGTLGRDAYVAYTNRGLVLAKPTPQNLADPAYRVAQSMVNNNFNFGGLADMEKFTGPQTKGVFEALGAGRSLAEWAHDMKTNGWDAGVLRQEMVESAKKVMGKEGETIDRKILLGAPRLVDFALREGARFTQAATLSEPFFRTAIPAIKFGQGMERGQRWLMSHMNATPEELDAYMRKVTMDLDNRLGEMQLDNTFASNALKRNVNIATISTSWVYGSYRGFAQALGYNVERHVFDVGTEGLRSFFPQKQAWEWNPVATTNLIGTLSSFALVNQVYSYLHGQGIGSDIRDLWTFRTGGKGSLSFSGIPERASFPSELKELTDLGTIIAQSAHHWTNAPEATMHYMMGKLNPFWQSILGLTTGEDGIGHRIGAYPGGLRRFLLDQITPIAASAVMNPSKGTALNWVERLMGIREAPKWIEDWNKYEGQVDGRHDRAVKEEMTRARKEVADQRYTPWWADEITGGGSKGGGSKSITDRQLQQYNGEAPARQRAPGVRQQERMENEARGEPGLATKSTPRAARQPQAPYVPGQRQRSRQVQ